MAPGRSAEGVGRARSRRGAPVAVPPANGNSPVTAKFETRVTDLLLRVRRPSPGAWAHGPLRWGGEDIEQLF